MKKEERLHRLFGDIDDDLVADAAPQPVPLRVWLPRVTAVVAAVALVVGVVLAQPWVSEKPPVQSGTAIGDGNGNATTTTAVSENDPICIGGQTLPEGGKDPDHVAPPKPSHKGTTTAAAGEIGTPDIWYEQPWGEWPLWKKFPRFERSIPEGYYGKMNYDVCESTIDKEMVEEYLEDVELYGYDGPNETAHTITGKLYRIKGFSPLAAVALQYAGENEYYPAVNRDYSPDTLGDLLEDFNLREHLRIGTVYESRNNGEHRQFHGLTVEALWELLMQDTSLPNVQKQGLVTPKGTNLTIEAAIPLLGNYQPYGIGVWENGYLDMSFGNVRKTFYIGEEAAKAFATYLQEHCRIVTTTTVQIPLTGDTTDPGTTMTSPAQPPLTTRHTIKG